MGFTETQTAFRYRIRKKSRDLKAVVFTLISPKKKVEDDRRRADKLTRKKCMSLKIWDRLLVECPFTEEIRNMDAVDFIRMMVKTACKIHGGGTDFHFGHNRMGLSAALNMLTVMEGR